MKTCFGYVRVSTQKQGEGVSLEAQRDAVTAFAEKNEITISKWFEEKETAAKRGRPVFTAMLKSLRHGKAAGVVMHRIDRSARNIGDWAKIGELSDAGIDVHFASETLDFRSRGGRLSADIQAVIAADFIRNLREETIKGMTGRLKQGLYPFKAPLGYLDNGRGQPKTPDPKRAALVRELFDLYASGSHSIYTLREEMIQRGLTNSAGRPPSKHLIESILGNPFYCGIIKIKRTGTTYQGIHQPLISAATFERVQAVKAGKAGKKVTRHNHLYRGLFRCANCERSMIPERQKGHVYYRCQTKDCPSNTVREDRLEAELLKCFLELRLSPHAIARIVSEVASWAEAEHGTEAVRLKLQKEKDRLSAQLDRLTDALADGHLEPDIYQQRRQSLFLDQQKLDEEFAKLQAVRKTSERVRAFLERVKSLASYYEVLKPDEKRQFVEFTLSNRRVQEKNVYFDLSSWVQTVKTMAADPCGDLAPLNSRSGRDLKKYQIEALVEIVWSDEVKRFLRKDNDTDLQAA